jgi:hypothetical protein
MATTTNFGWETPDDTDLVKDGAAAIRTALGGVDTSFVDLKGGTTGQVLAKASGTDLDFSWVAQDDSNAIQNAIVDAKGDLIAATAADTPARLAVGTNGQILTADSTAATGLAWAAPASSGGMTLLSTTTLSGATTITVNSISQSYTNLMVVIDTFYATSASNFFVKFNNNSLLQWIGTRNVDGTSANFNSGASGANIDNGFSIYNGTAGYADGSVATNYILDIPNYSSTTGQKSFVMYGGGVTSGSTNWSASTISGRYVGNSGITRLDFTMSSNFSTGTVKIWGIK